MLWHTMVQHGMTLFRFLHQDNNEHQKEHQVLLLRQLQCHRQLWMLSARAIPYSASLLWGWKPVWTQLLPQDKTFRKHSQRKSLNSPRGTCESQQGQHQVLHTRHSQWKTTASSGHTGPNRQRNNYDWTHPCSRWKPGEKSRQSTDFVSLVSEEKIHQEKK